MKQYKIIIKGNEYFELITFENATTFQNAVFIAERLLKQYESTTKEVLRIAIVAEQY